MPTLVIKGKIVKDYSHWVKVYDEAEVLQKHMENEAELIASAGGSTNPEDNIITLCSD